MGTIVEFRLLVLYSLKYSSNAESRINRSAKAVISRNLTTSRHNHLFVLFICFIYFYFLLFMYFSSFIFFYFYLIYFSFSYIYRKQENRHYRLICIAIPTVVIGWLEWIYIYIYYIYVICLYIKEDYL